MKPTLTHPSWYDIEKATAKIANNILKRPDVRIEYIIGLARGGLPAAVLMSHMLDIPMAAANYSSVDGHGDNKNHDNFLPSIMGEFESGTGQLPKSPTLLLIDDIADSGRTLKEVQESYQDEGHVVYTAAIYWKRSSIHTPDFYCHSISGGDPWIVFPWEV